MHTAGVAASITEGTDAAALGKAQNPVPLAHGSTEGRRAGKYVEADPLL